MFLALVSAQDTRESCQMGSQVLKCLQLYQRAGGQLIKHKGKGRWKACTAEGWSSAKVTLVRRYITASRTSAQ